ncbi:hypothetical protein C8R44DRAFT_309483 [Mycena epipterygia]|nr:hypothetical protein C8R44DRAFT_309483 [Mycena epipterygia]
MWLTDIENSYPDSLKALVMKPLIHDPDAPQATFESEVDRIISAHLNWFFPVQNDFYVAPQATYAAEIVDEDLDKIQDLWSIVVEARSPPQPGPLEIYPQSEDSSMLFSPMTTSTPKGKAKDTSAETGSDVHTPPTEQYHPSIGTFRSPSARTELPSVLPDVALDFFKRMVHDIGRRQIKWPDFCVTFKDEILVIAEDKLLNRAEAIGQLQQYMHDLYSAGSEALGMACVLGLTGLEVAMFRRSPVGDFHWLGGQGTWHLASHPFVRAELWKIRQRVLHPE